MNLPRRLVCSLGLPALFVSTLQAQPAASTVPAWPLPVAAPASAGLSADRLASLHRNLDRLVDEGKYSGYVALLARGGRIVDWRAHGWLDIAARTPMQPDTIVQIDPKERTVALLLCQHFPWNQDDIFATFTNGYYSALID